MFNLVSKQHNEDGYEEGETLVGYTTGHERDSSSSVADEARKLTLHTFIRYHGKYFWPAATAGFLGAPVQNPARTGKHVRRALFAAE